MKWSPPLTEAIILKRYKRFLSDIQLHHEIITAHVPNTGSMQSCWEENWKCAVSKSSNPDRKLPFTLEMTHNGETFIGANTANANKLVSEWLHSKLIETLSGYQTIVSEKKTRDSRIDFYLENHPTLAPCYVEVKSVTLKLDGYAQFPDSVSVRGQKHLKELMSLKKSGQRAMMLYVIQREDIEHFKPADSIDPEYGRLLREASKLGVEILAIRCMMSLNEITYGKPITIDLG